MRGWSATAFLALLLLPACTALPQACAPPAQAMIAAELMFGRKIGDRIGVSDAAFAAFVAREITPRFPDGLTVIDAKGQWRDSSRGVIVREPSKLVLITFADDARRRADIAAIVDAYKQTFSQQSVMTSLRPSCVTF
ncbi:hypothetical protein X566_23610 [Afipia sp. P52-10]|nr:hypothetical protein X566_23610 [Afipia sp. P52-10]